MKKVTIRDVAAKAGVSISSVSRYLADPKSIAPLAAYNIKTAVAELNYSPNAYAQSLKRGNSKIVGVVIPHVEFFFGRACSAISDFFYERGYVVFICESENDGPKERFFVQQLLDQRAAGLIVVPSGHNTPFLAGIARDYGRMVLFDRGEDIGCDIVSADHEEGAYRLAAGSLAGRRGDRILLLLGAETASSTRALERGGRRALDERGIAGSLVEPVYGCRDAEKLGAAVRTLGETLRPDERPLILALGEEFLETAVMALNQCGSDAADRIDVAGFAMPDTLGKLGRVFPCVIKDPRSAGIRVSEALYGRMADAAADEARIIPIPVEYRF